MTSERDKELWQIDWYKRSRLFKIYRHFCPFYLLGVRNPTLVRNNRLRTEVRVVVIDRRSTVDSSQSTLASKIHHSYRTNNFFTSRNELIIVDSSCFWYRRNAINAKFHDFTFPKWDFQFLDTPRDDSVMKMRFLFFVREFRRIRFPIHTANRITGLMKVTRRVESR